MTEQTDQTTQWCGWCRDHGYTQTAEANAVISNYISGHLQWPVITVSEPRPNQEAGYIHIHGLHHVHPSELTVKATLLRSARRARRNARRNIASLLTTVAFKVRGDAW